MSPTFAGLSFRAEISFNTVWSQESSESKKGLFLIYCDKTYNLILSGEYEVPCGDSDVLNAKLYLLDEIY